MPTYKKQEIDFEVGDFVCFNNDDNQQPYLVLEINRRFITDDETDPINRIMVDAYNLKIGDEINSMIRLKAFKIGGEKESLRDDIEDMDGWDSAFFYKLELDHVESSIVYQEKRVANEVVKLGRLNKTRELIIEELKKKKIVK